jgi:hypothetical protein
MGEFCPIHEDFFNSLKEIFESQLKPYLTRQNRNEISRLTALLGMSYLLEYIPNTQYKEHQ